MNAALALGKIGPDAKAAVPLLTKLLKDEERQVQVAAIHALGGIGPDSKPAVPALREFSSRTARRWFGRSLLRPCGV